MRKMTVNISLILSLLISIFYTSTFVSACRILGTHQAIAFVFQETFENHTAGTKLPGELQLIRGRNERVAVIQTKSCDPIVQKYIRSEINEECGCIHFYLQDNKTLREYRKERWMPSLEYEFGVECSSEENEQTYTYMLGIKDENLYPPEFTDPRFQLELEYTLLRGYQITYKDKNNIRVIDRDFNPNHANVQLSCEGSACNYFNFTPTCVSVDNGHNFDIRVTPQNIKDLKKVMKDGKSFTVQVSATDNTYRSQWSAQFEIQALLKDDFEDSSYKLIFGIAGGIIGVILVSCSGTVAFLTMRGRKAKDLLRKLTEAEINEFLQGNASIGVAEAKRSVDVNTPIMAMPYNRSFEIQREKLRIDETTILGTGAFGIVWKGSVMYSNGDGITVAVKTVKRNVGILYFKALLSELKIMAYIGKHPNIVSLVGACTHNIRKREVYIAVQYCANGNFHNYLKCRRDRFSNLVVDGNLQLTNSATYSYMYSGKGCFSKSISTMDLLKWATQIANGLQYLESLGVIHGDLATRNVLLDSERTAKIGDFGLSRRLIDYSNYYYTKTSQAPLPWKWMSPESLKDMRFSKKSDIWSFGIVLWEVFTLGQTPYPGLNWDETFVERLEKGMRPVRPAFASNLLYDIMVDCWHLDPHDRPAVLDIKRALENITSSALRQKADMSYMKFLGEQTTMKMINEDEQGYLEPADPNRRTSMEA